MKVNVRVENNKGEIIHDRIGEIRAQHHLTIKAAHTRIMNRMQRIYPDWKWIEIRKVEA